MKIYIFGKSFIFSFTSFFSNLLYLEKNILKIPSRFVVLYLLLIFPFIDSLLSGSNAEFKREALFENTEYELNIYHIYGREDGKTMLIIGGMHNEPGGYLTADKYVNISLEKGNLIVVPRANFNTIIHNDRAAGGDMNRKFAQNGKPTDYYEVIVEKIKQLMSDSDIVLNLHEGSGFYIETYVDKLRNPKRYGQSIIADSDKYFSKKNNNYIYLEEIARKILESVNSEIENKKYHFRFNNHRTSDEKTLHKEQRLSATYYALTNLEIPAFGLEVSKELPNIEIKVKYLSQVINEFMKEFDIIPEYPGSNIDNPVLKFLNVLVNNEMSLSLKNNETFYVNPGDEIEITHIETNYDRGIYADIKGYGNAQDFAKKFKVYKDAVIIIGKDYTQCGNVYMALKKGKQDDEISTSEDYFLISINNRLKKIFSNEEINVIKGDIIKIVDISPSLKRFGNVKVNFYGYVAPDKSAEDRGYSINTKNDLLPNYSVNKKGKKYEIRVEDWKGGNLKILKKINVNILEPKLEYIALIVNGNKKLWFYDNEVINLSHNDYIRIIDVKTNLSNNEDYGVKVNFYGFVGRGDAKDMNMNITFDSLLKEYSIAGKGERYEIRISIGNYVFGKIYVDISPKNVTKLDILNY